MSVSLRYFLSSFLCLASVLFFLPSESAYHVLLIVFSFLLFTAGFFYLEKEKPNPFTLRWLPWVLLIFITGITVIRSEYYPSYSTDFFRYFWDALLFDRSVNPLMAEPKATLPLFYDLAKLYPYLSSNDTFSFFPPTTQLFFYLSYTVPQISSSVEYFMIRYQIFYSMFFVIIAYCYAVWIRWNDKELNLTWFLAFILCPFFIFYSVFELHPELLGSGLLLIGILVFQRKYFFVAGVFFALSVWSTVYVMWVVPFVLVKPKAIGTRSELIQWLLGFVITSIFLWLPFVLNLNLSALLASYFSFLISHENHSFLFALLQEFLDSVGMSKTPSLIFIFLSIFYVLIFYLLIRIALTLDLLKDRLILSLYAYLFFLLGFPVIHSWSFFIPLILVFMTRKISLGLLVWMIVSALFDFIPVFHQMVTDNLVLRFVIYSAVLIVLGFDYFEHVSPILTRSRIKVVWKKIESLIGNSHLDIGTRNGELLANFPHSIFSVGTDIKNYRQENNPMGYVVQPENRLPFKSESFETSSAILSLHHSSNPEDMISELKRVTTKRMMVVEITIKSHFHNEMLDWLGRIFNLCNGIHSHLSFQTQEHWEKMLGDDQWKIISVQQFGLFISKKTLFILEKSL